MDPFKTLTFHPWGPTAPSSSHPQQVLVFCSTHPRPVYKINTTDHAIDVSNMGVIEADGDYQCIAQYQLTLQSRPRWSWETNLYTTHSPCVFGSFSRPTAAYYISAAHLGRARRSASGLTISRGSLLASPGPLAYVTRALSTLTADLFCFPAQYDIIDDGYVLASLRVDQGYIKVDVRAKYKVQIGLCDGIVRAVVVMSARRDAWLQGANIQVADEEIQDNLRNITI